MLAALTAGKSLDIPQRLGWNRERPPAVDPSVGPWRPRKTKGSVGETY